MSTPTCDVLPILQTLAEHQVDSIVVGGVAAMLQGVPSSALGLDVVHARAPENLKRLLSALQILDACHRTQGTRVLKLNLTDLASPGRHLLMTRLGPLTLLGTVGTGHGYEELLKHTLDLQLGGGLQGRVLDLPTLITIKEEAGTELDRAELPILRRTLEERFNS
jgi:hypothetical protein